MTHYRDENPDDLAMSFIAIFLLAALIIGALLMFAAYCNRPLASERVDVNDLRGAAKYQARASLQ